MRAKRVVAMLAAASMAFLFATVQPAGATIAEDEFFVVGYDGTDHPQHVPYPDAAGEPDGVLLRMNTSGEVLNSTVLPFDEFMMSSTWADRNLTEDALYVFVSGSGYNQVDGVGQLQKFDANLDLVWSKPFEPDPGYPVAGYMNARVSANPYLGGAYVGAWDGVRRFAPDGTVLWGPLTYGVGGGDWIVAADSLTGGLYAAHSANNRLLKLDANGAVLWQATIASPQTLNFSPTDGGVYVGAGGSYAPRTHKYAANGTLSWSRLSFLSPYTYSRTTSAVDGGLYVMSGWNEYLGKLMPDNTGGWTYLMGGGYGNSSVVADPVENTVYVSLLFERLGVYAFDGVTGTQIGGNLTYPGVRPDPATRWDPGIYTPHWHSMGCPGGADCHGYGPQYYLYMGLPSSDEDPPTITITAPADLATYTLDDVVSADYGCTDEGSGVATCEGPVPDGEAIDTGTVGSKTFAVTATDARGNTMSSHVHYTVAYDWSGFFAPVDPQPTLNTVRAGRAVPVQFSLDGDFGLGVFSAGSQQASCDGSEDIDAIEVTLAAGGSSLSYDPLTDTYTYVWKTDKAWGGTCRLLTVTLADTTVHLADFRFLK